LHLFRQGRIKKIIDSVGFFDNIKYLLRQGAKRIISIIAEFLVYEKHVVIPREVNIMKLLLIYE
jgi:hypothetical protein